jgi:hypothetical protein
MPGTVLHEHWESLLLGIPFLLMLLVGIFRLDELIVAPKHRPRRSRPASGLDADGNIILSDPDGRRWNSPRQPR